MPYTAQCRREMAEGGESVGTTETITGSGRGGFDETIADGQTDLQVNVAIDVTAVTCFIITTDRAITIETNDGGAPDDTITLSAGETYMWTNTQNDTFKLTADVTAFFITNASGGNARVQCKFLYDATP